MADELLFKEKTIEFILPWPPSVNNYYMRAKNGTVILSKEGRNYRDLVYLLLLRYARYFDEKDRISIFIQAFPPDKKKRDLDNLLKASLDAIQFADVIDDDNQIDMIKISRHEVIKEGELRIAMTKI